MKKLLHERLREAYILDELEVGNGIPISLFEDEANALADEIEKYYIPLPLDEYGEPWNIGDECVHTRWFENNQEGWHVSGYTDDAIIVCNGGNELHVGLRCIKRPSPKVLDADGVEINVGDTVWVTTSGRVDRCIVQGFTDGGCVDVRFEPDYVPSRISPKCITHIEPDSLEKLRDDMAQVTDQKDVDYGDMEAWINRLSALIERGA